MLTQCPECQTVFRLSLGQLEAADGRVRCGVCDTIFDALSAAGEAQPEDDADNADGELEGEDAEADSALEAEPTHTIQDVAAAGDESDDPSDLEPDAEPESSTAEVEVASEEIVVDPEPSPESLEDTAENEILNVEIESTPSIEITMEGERIDIDGEELIEELVEDTGELAAVAQPPADAAVDLTDDDLSVEVEVPLEALARAAASAQAERAKHDLDHDDDDDLIVLGPLKRLTIADAEPATIPSAPQEALEPVSSSRSHEMVLPSGRRVIIGGGEPPDESATDEALPSVLVPREQSVLRSRWVIGSAVVGALLLIQLIHFNRDALARTSVLGPAVATVYGWFGAELSPAWNLRAFELRQWGASADPKSGALRVRASLFNNGEHDQPFPVLRLTLQDRFGGRVATRDLEPIDYLPRTHAGKILPAGQRVDTQIAVVDPGKDAVGFEMDVCLHEKDARIVCASDARRP